MKSLFLAFLATHSLFAAAEPDSRPILVVVGMASEAQIAKGPGGVLVLSAGRGDLLRERLKQFSREKVRAVISFGIAGGLDPALKPGDLFVSEEVVTEKSSWKTDPALNKKIRIAARMAGLQTHKGTTVGEDFLGGTDRPSKIKLHESLHADLVDNESHVAAEFAAHEGLPFALVRVVDDPFDFELPPAALLPLLPNGKPDGQAILRSLSQHHGQLPALIQAARDEAKALAALRKVRRVLDLEKF